MSNQEIEAGVDTALYRRRLNSAAIAGIVSEAQVTQLIEFWERQDRLEEQQAAVRRVDAEEVRFVRGFHDVFIAIGIVILLSGMLFGLGDLVSPGVSTALTAAAVWVLSEIFARKMRLALPSFLLSVAFTPLFLSAVLMLFTGDGNVEKSLDLFDGVPPSETSVRWALVLPAAIAVVASTLHYLRFKVPVGAAGIFGSSAFLVLLLVNAVAPGVIDQNFALITLATGLAAFAAAMAFDTRDLTRTTVNSDKAFWLHLFAAPLIVHSVLYLAVGKLNMDVGSSYAGVVMALFLALSLVAIIVDRRAILVSGLGYFGYAIATVVTQSQISGNASIALTMVLLGGFILLLGSAWRPVRKAVISPFSSTSLMQYVPAAA